MRGGQLGVTVRVLRGSWPGSTPERSVRCRTTVRCQSPPPVQTMASGWPAQLKSATVTTVPATARIRNASPTRRRTIRRSPRASRRACRSVRGWFVEDGDGHHRDDRRERQQGPGDDGRNPASPPTTVRETSGACGAWSESSTRCLTVLMRPHNLHIRNWPPATWWLHPTRAAVVAWRCGAPGRNGRRIGFRGA